jgi:hypothetical protein
MAVQAYWFYKFLSIVYDHVVNPGHWTEDMREAALAPAQLDRPDLKVCSCLRVAGVGVHRGIALEVLHSERTQKTPQLVFMISPQVSLQLVL